MVDENFVRKRATDPRLRTGALGSVPDGTATPPPPVPVVVTAAPSLLGLPGQAIPDVPDFDAPTVARDLPIPPVQTETPRRPPPPPALLGSAPTLDEAPATLVDAASPVAQGSPAARTTPASSPPQAPIDLSGTPAAAIRPAAEPPEFTHGGRPRPVRERRATAPQMPVQVTDTEVARPATALDPPVEPSTPRARPMTLDPPVEPSNPRARPVALDPAVEPSNPRARPTMALDPVESSSSTPPAEVSGGRARPQPTATRSPTPGVIAAAAAVVVVGLAIIFGGGGRGEHRFSQADERRLADLWLAEGAPAWGGVREDGVARAVESVGAAVARPMSSRLDGRAPRFVVVNDESSAQAFALPDATVVVTTAALRRLGNEAQLAALLAHTLAHVALGDVTDVLDRAADVETAVREGLGGGPSKAAVELVAKAATVPHLPTRELEADAIALEVLGATGYAPGALVDVIRNFGIKGGTRRSAWLSQHPDDPARTSAAAKAPAGGRTNETEYTNRVLDQIGRFGAATPAPAGEKKNTLRVLTPPPGGPVPLRSTTQTPGPPALPPDVAPPHP